MKNGNLLIALVIGGVIGFVIGKTTSSSSTTSAPSAVVAQNDAKPSAAPARPAAAGDDKSVYKIPVGNAPVKGPATAKITIVEYSDFQCPFCSRVGPTLKQIHDTYGANVRVAFKQNPLPFHQDAPLAAEASLAANEQGKFWEMHDKLFANQANLKREDLEKYAQELGLDMGKFKAALDSHKFKDQIEKDKAEAANFQANGTPHFFVNGVRVKGARPFADFKTVIDEQLAKADKLAASGVKPADIYEAATKDGLTKGAAPAPAPRDAAPQAAQVRQIKEKDLAGSPVTGASKAKVTIVEWSDFQCPFCSRVVPTIEKIVKDYPKDVRLIFKHQPLPFHPNAAPAAIASIAAHNQGKFWQFHDKAFEHQKELSPENYEAWAKELGLNMSKFKADIADPKTKAAVDADARMGSTYGANGTPTFFINGIEMAGALPYEQFKAKVDEQIKLADEQLKNGVKLDDLYEKMLAVNAAAAPKAPPAAAAPADDGKPVKIDIGNAPVRGDAKAKVTIVEFSDFQCPFCSRGAKTVEAVLEKYKGKVKVAFKHQPLPFHPQAKPAAKAALAAGEQGKFWEMHDKMFGNQKELAPEKYEEWAKELGLNMSKFKEAMASAKYDAMIDADSQFGTSVGAGGTPTFFINGRKLVGAQPQEQFEAIIEEELKK
jgi:protein-disulfide isomerase